MIGMLTRGRWPSKSHCRSGLYFAANGTQDYVPTMPMQVPIPGPPVVEAKDLCMCV